MTVAPDFPGFLGSQDLDAETPGLRDRPARQVVAAEARRKAEVVLDTRAQSRLASRRLAFHDHRAEPLRGAINARRQTGRPAADNYQVEETRLGARAQT